MPKEHTPKHEEFSEIGFAISASFLKIKHDLIVIIPMRYDQWGSKYPSKIHIAFPEDCLLCSDFCY